MGGPAPAVRSTVGRRPRKSPGATSAQKRVQPWVMIVAALGAGAVVLVGCGSVLVKGGQELYAASQDANAYAQAVVADRDVEAYAMRCDADRNLWTLEQFGESHAPTFSGYAIESLHIRTMNGVTSGAYVCGWTEPTEARRCGCTCRCGGKTPAGGPAAAADIARSTGTSTAP